MQTNVTISNDRNAVDDTCLTTFQIVDRFGPARDAPGRQLRRSRPCSVVPAGLPGRRPGPLPPSPQDTRGSDRNGFISLSRVPEYRCGAGAARDLTGWEHIDGTALAKG